MRGLIKMTQTAVSNGSPKYSDDVFTCKGSVHCLTIGGEDTLSEFSGKRRTRGHAKLG